MSLTTWTIEGGAVALVLAACVLGALGWGLMWRHVRHAGLGPHAGAMSLLPVMMGLGLVLRVVVALGTPDFQAPDEHAHFNYVKFLAEQRTFPVQTSMTNAPSNDWEYYQPPLYYLAQLPVYLAAQAAGVDVPATLRAMRLMSVALWALAAWGGWRFLRALGCQDAPISLCVLSLVCFLPAYVSLSSVVNNDNLVLALGALSLGLAARAELSWRSALASGLLLGLAALAKFSAVVYLVALVSAVLCQHGLTRRAWAHLLVAGGVAGLLVSPWLARNLVVYGSLTAESVANVPFDWNIFWHNPQVTAVLTVPDDWAFVRLLLIVPALLFYAVLSFWAGAGKFNEVYGVFPTIGLVVSLLVTHRLWRQWRLVGGLRQVLPPGLRWPWVLALLITLAVNVALVLRFGVLYQQGQGRFLFPMIMPAGVLMGLALASGRGLLASQPVHVAGFFFLYACAFAAYSLTRLNQLWPA